jgi:hypothetical protein
VDKHYNKRRLAEPTKRETDLDEPVVFEAGELLGIVKGDGDPEFHEFEPTDHLAARD